MERVVVVRDVGVSTVALLANRLRAAGAGTVLLTAPVHGEERAALAAVSDEIVEIADPYDVGQVVAAVRGLAGSGPVPPVVSNCDGVSAVAARAAEELGVARGPARAFEASRNKYGMRCALREAGLPGPEFGLLHSADDAAEVGARVGFPAVLKPVNGAGSHGIRLVHTVDELASAYREVSGGLLDTPLGENYAHPVAGPDGPVDPARSLLVEGALGGREYCVDLIVRDGAVEQLPLVDKYAIDERFFERGFVSPPLDLDGDGIRAIQDVVDAAVRAVGLDNTVAHIEIRDDPEFGPTIVEINAGRPGGEIVAYLNQSTTGIDVYGELVALILGAPQPERQPPPLPMDLASIVLYPTGSGRLVSVRGLDECARIPEVLRVVPLYQTGRMMVEDYECPLAVLLVAGFSDRKQLLEIQAEAEALISAELAGSPGERS